MISKIFFIACVLASGYNAFKLEIGNSAFWLALACLFAICMLYEKVSALSKSNGVLLFLLSKIRDEIGKQQGDGK